MDPAKVKNLKLIDANISSIQQLKISEDIVSLNLHHNSLRYISGLQSATALQYLDLSSNFIDAITGLDALVNLRILNLSSNAITAVSGLRGLVSLERIDLSFNSITNLDGLGEMHGPNYKLETIHLQGNRIQSIENLTSSLMKVKTLRYLTLLDPQADVNNPVCAIPAYRRTVLARLPHISVLDYYDRSGAPNTCHTTSHIPELSDFLSRNHSESLTTPTPNSASQEVQSNPESTIPSHTEQRLVNLETQLSSLIALHLQKIGGNPFDSNMTTPSSSDLESRDEEHVENRTRAGSKIGPLMIPVQHQGESNTGVRASNLSDTTATSETKPVNLPRANSEHPPGAPKRPVVNPSDRGQPMNSRFLVSSTERENLLLDERSRQREYTKGKQGQPRTSRQMVSRSAPMNHKTLDEVKRELKAERKQREQLEKRCESLNNRLMGLQARVMDEHKVIEATDKLKRAFSSERLARIQAEARLREIDKLTRDCQKASARAEVAEKKFEELKYVLDVKNKELAVKANPLDDPEVTRIISERIGLVEAKHEETIRGLNKKLEQSSASLHGLENEFREALRLEAERYEAVYNRAEQLHEKLNSTEASMKELEQREADAQQIVADLMEALREQKANTLRQEEANRSLERDHKERILCLESQLKDVQQRAVDADDLRHQLERLKVKLKEKETSLINLRAERRNWCEELAKQSSALAQDRSSMETTIESQATEIEQLKKSLQEQIDKVKIQTKVIDDQAASIEQLKKNIKDQEFEVKRAREQVTETKRQSEQEIGHLKQQEVINQEKITNLLARKQELKEVISASESRIRELEVENNSLNLRWSERSNLLDKLEVQVEQMRENWEREKGRLINERDVAKDQTEEITRYMKQMASDYEEKVQKLIKAKNEAESLQSAWEKRVAEVEAEMRALLMEQETMKKMMQLRLRKLTDALFDQPEAAYNLYHTIQSTQFTSEKDVDSTDHYRDLSYH